MEAPTLPTLSRPAVKNLLSMMEVFEELVINGKTKDQSGPPADMVAEHGLCKADLNDFLDNTTDDEWHGAAKHAQIIIYLYSTRDMLKKLAMASLLKDMLLQEDE